jgi:CubicO group peptidase (beta-lactamase class C family)
MMLNGGEFEGTRLLGRKTVEKMTRNHLPAALLPIDMGGMLAPGIGFGPGFGICMDETQSCYAASEGAFYWGGAASTYAYVDPHEELVGVLMTQVLNNMLPFDQYFRQMVFQALVE